MSMRLLLATLVFLTVPAAAQDATTTGWTDAIDGDRLTEGQACFALKAGENVVGFPRETITPAVSIEGPAWRIVSEQVLPEGLPLLGVGDCLTDGGVGGGGCGCN